MRLLSSADTLSFLCKNAPKPWVKRMLKWMIFTGEVDAYFTRGRIVPSARVFSVLLAVPGILLPEADANRDKIIRENFDPELAERLISAGAHGSIDDEPTEWDESEEPHKVSAGFFIYSDDIDWEGGKLIAEIPYPDRSDKDMIFWDHEEHLLSEFEHPEFAVTLSGLCFPLDTIEMLLPTSELIGLPDQTKLPEAAIGRPRKWDWEGAFGHLVVLAQHPDGLPTGPGSQAKIEKHLLEWFVSETGDSPASSQLRQRASKMTRMLSAPKTKRLNAE